MSEFIIPAEAPDLNQLKERRLDRLARRAILALLKRLRLLKTAIAAISVRFRIVVLCRLKLLSTILKCSRAFF